TMPAWGTVTTSPACSRMLLRVSPVSRRSFRLMVMEVASGFGEFAAASGVADDAGGLACANSSAEGKGDGFDDALSFFSAGTGAAGGSRGGGSPEPGAAVAEADCGLATSTIEKSL